MRVLFSKGIVAISKPRCGSTSVRRMLDPFMDVAKGDIAVNVAGESPSLHPHMTAPYLFDVMRERGYDMQILTSFVTIRDPREMLWSYYKFFRPDQSCNYNFSPNWMSGDPMKFEDWVCTGRLGSNPEWLQRGPGWISQKNLSPLSLEAHIEDTFGNSVVDRVFQIENISELVQWLREHLNEDLKVLHSNKSTSYKRPNLGVEATEKIRAMFPKEASLYGV